MMTSFIFPSVGFPSKRKYDSKDMACQTGIFKISFSIDNFPPVPPLIFYLPFNCSGYSIE